MTILNKVSSKTLMPGITPIPDVPDAPTIGAVTDAGDGTTATVAYTVAVTGGTASTFTATSTPGSFTGTGSSPISVTGLTAGTAYTFKVKGTNATATGAESAASSSLTLAAPLSYYSIATITSSGSSGAISFTSIPSTYKHLQLRGILRTNDTGTWNNQQMLFNSDTGTNYKSHTFSGDGTSATTGTVSVVNSFNDFMRAASNSLSAGIFGTVVIDILDYTDTNKNKVFKALHGGDSNGAGVVGLTSGVWFSTSAINTITINPSGGTAIQYSSFALYGIKG